jgi:hypothetical protein
MAVLFSSRQAAGAPEAGRSGERPASRAIGLSRLIASMYAAAVLFFFTAAVDIYTLAWPLDPGAPAWRFGTMGAAANYLLTAFIGVALGCWVAAFAGHLRTLRILGVFSALLGLLLLLVFADFCLSVLQLRDLVGPEEMQAFRIGSAKAGAKYLAMAAALLITAFGAWRAAGSLRRPD